MLSDHNQKAKMPSCNSRRIETLQFVLSTIRVAFSDVYVCTRGDRSVPKDLCKLCLHPNKSIPWSVCLPTHPHFIKHLQAGKHQRNAFKSLIYYSDGEKILMFFPPGSELNARITIAF